MAAAMGGLDALVFTGGVGENATAIRGCAAAGLGFLGIALDPIRNSRGQLDAEIGTADAPVRTFAIRAREDLQITHDVRRALADRRALLEGAASRVVKDPEGQLGSS